MAFYRNNKNRRNYRSSNNRNTSYYNDKPTYSTPQLPEPQTTSSTFPNDTSRELNSTTYKTAFETTRSYDVTADKVDIQVPGAAPIFGTNTPAQNMTFPQELADFNASLNNVYAGDEMALVSTIRRGISLNYMGMDTSVRLNDTSHTIPDIKTYKAYQYWLRNTAQLVTEISSAMYTDLKIFRWTYGSQWEYGGNDLIPGLKSPWSGYVGVAGNSQTVGNPQLTDIAYMLLQYQLEVLYVVILCYAFEQLVTQLPKLQELYYTKRNYFTYIQNQLKRSKYTATVKSLLTWLKSRYIDKNFFKEFILPTLIASKSTDGLNSPIMYLIPTLNTTVDYLYDKNMTDIPGKKSTAQTINTFMLTQLGFSASFDSSHPLPEVKYSGIQDSALLPKELNAFSVDTILDAVVTYPTFEQFKAAINTWLNTAFNLLQTTEQECVVFSNKPVIIDIETMLSKMATAPKGLNWTTNLEVATLPPMMKYSNWELVNELVLYQSGPRITSVSGSSNNQIVYDNGFMQNLPFFRDTGLPKTFLYEYSQAMNGPSDQNYITFFTVSSDVKVKLRDRTTTYVLKSRKFKEPKTGKELGCFWLTGAGGVNDLLNAYPIFQDKITAMFTTETGTTGFINSHLMSAVTLIYKNKWAEIGQYLNRNFIIPLA